MESINIFEWIEEKNNIELCTSDMFIYDDMISQSGYSLPIIYTPFNSSLESHWVDRGYLYDFLYSISGTGKEILDFGPGDGWPSLILAPFVKKVIGLDSSVQRIKVCRENAAKLNIDNTQFVHYNTGNKLPFEVNSFDGITAASSIEQSPEPYKILEELYRVLKPAGKIRIHYESLNMYENGMEKDIWITAIKDNQTCLIIFDRKIKEEYVIQYGIIFDIKEEEFIEKLLAFNKLTPDNTLRFEHITIELLEKLKPRIIKVKKCNTIHPSGKTLVEWMKKIGFKEILPSYNGGYAAGKIFEYYYNNSNNRTRINNVFKLNKIDEVDELIKPVVKVVTELEAPIEKNPAITVVK